MKTQFDVVACHGDHAGKAHLAVRLRDGGAEIALRDMPFESHAKEALTEEQARILRQAAQIARDLADFLDGEARTVREWPTRCPKLGAYPTEGEAPNAFGYPISRA